MDTADFLDDKPDLKWGGFVTRLVVSILALIAGTIGGALTDTGVSFWWTVALAGLAVIIMIALVAPRGRDDEFDRAISMRAGTFAGLSTLVFLVIDQLQAQVSGTRIIETLAAPGYFAGQWLILAQYLRWTFSQRQGG